MYTSSLIATFNVVWTSWPTIGFAVLEQVRALLPLPVLSGTLAKQDVAARTVCDGYEQNGCCTATGMMQHGFLCAATYASSYRLCRAYKTPCCIMPVL